MPRLRSRLRLGQRRPFVQRETQIFELHRFGNHIVDTGLETFFDVRLQRVGGDRDDRQAILARSSSSLPDVLHQFVAIHLRHAYIGQQRVILVILPLFQRLDAVLHEIGGVAQNLELRRDQLLVDSVILGNQDPGSTGITIRLRLIGAEAALRCRPPAQR